MKSTIIAAFVTGLFTVIAGVVTYWLTQKQPELTYSVVRGPMLESLGAKKQILGVTVTNTGKKEIATTTLVLEFATGKIEDASFDASPGVNVTQSKQDGSIELVADVLNPGEALSASILATSNTEVSLKAIAVRAPGVVGTQRDDSQRDKKQQLPVLLVAALGASLSVLMAATPLARRIFHTKPLYALAGSLDQHEVISYICGRAGLQEEAEKLRFSSAEVTYRGAADYLMFRAQQAGVTSKAKYLAALKAMLLNDHMSPVSVPSIQHAITQVAGQPFSDEEVKLLTKGAIGEGEKPHLLRAAIDLYIDQYLKERVEA